MRWFLRWRRKARKCRFYPEAIEAHLRESGLSPWSVPAEELQGG